MEKLKDNWETYLKHTMNASSVTGSYRPSTLPHHTVMTSINERQNGGPAVQLTLQSITGGTVKEKEHWNLNSEGRLEGHNSMRHSDCHTPNDAVHEGQSSAFTLEQTERNLVY